MKLENQVISLELAKKLKELGVTQESTFYWDAGSVLQIRPHLTDWYDGQEVAAEVAATFTVAELGEMLPWMVEANGQSYFIEFAKNGPQFHGGKHHVCYVSGEDEQEALGEMMPSITEADARAKMLIYLLENKLIEV